MVSKRKAAGSLLSGFKENMDIPIAAILILNTAAHTIGTAVAGASYSNVFDPNTLWIFSVVFTMAVLLFTEIIPKTLGVAHSRKLATPVAYGVNFLTIVLRPILWVSERISRAFRGDSDIPVTSMDEIRLMAILGRSEGVVGEQAAEMIVGATQLRHMDAHDVMLPREEIQLLSADMDRATVLALVRDSGHSRFPFSPTTDIDDMNGVVLTKDLLIWMLENDREKIDWDAVRKEPLVVPDSAPVLQLLHTYQESRRHLAIIVDEYGTVGGLATMEDVLEEIVGDIRDESDLPANDLDVQEDGTVVLRSDVDLRRLCEKLSIPWEPAAEITTVGGLVTEKLERIPVAGDSIQWNGYQVKVLRADRRRVRMIQVR
ncbi:MAG: hemolysin family protein, partial [Pseudomonadota bacterium]|nr:hemolysin family protein [Pseudomonadota bacterium]